jgi:hypothetical protein
VNEGKEEFSCIQQVRCTEECSILHGLPQGTNILKAKMGESVGGLRLRAMVCTQKN